MAAHDDDPALDVLFQPLRDGALHWPPPGGTLVLRARPGPPMLAAAPHAPRCEQTFRPWADALARDGLDVSPHVAGRFPLVLVLPTRQRDESRALLVRALDALAPGGALVACAHNDEGARSMQRDVEALLGPVRVDTRRHCRVVWAAPADAAVDAATRDTWRGLDAPRPVAGGRWRSRPGLFAWDRIDAGSAQLIEALPPDLAGHGADFGAGVGVLAREVLARCPGVAALDLYEAEARALELARGNLAGARVPLAFHWHDVAGGVAGRYDFVVTNPPFHQRRAESPDLGRAFIAAAAAALRPGGRLLLVANRHLPYEQALDGAFASRVLRRDEGGFKVIEAVRG